MFEETTPVVPVLIVGGGLVGLSTALFLAWHAIPYVLIERQARTASDLRSLRLSTRSTELFRSIGLEDAVYQAGVVLAERSRGGADVWHKSAHAEMNAISPTCPATCARAKLELLLRAHAEQAGGELRFSTALLSFTQDHAGVSAIVRDRATGSERPIHARYMIVTDNSRSRTRRSLGIAEHCIRGHELVAQVADSFQAGRVFLAGAAAHYMPPAGDADADIGVQDAHNLAWKLAATIKGMAGDALLATYAAERRPLADLAAQQTLLHEDDLANAHGYRSAAVCAEAGDDALALSPPCQAGRPGTRAAHIVLERNGERFSTLDLFGRYFVLLAGADGSAWRDASLCVSDRMGIELVARRIGHGGDLIDIDQRWQAAYGVTASGAVLVRPDGVIGWRSLAAAEHPEHTLAQALAQLMGRSQEAGVRSQESEA